MRHQHPAAKANQSILLAAILLWGCTSSSPPIPAPPSASESESESESESVLHTTLDNGLRVIIVRDPLAPAVTTVMNYQVGSDDEAIHGLAHALEHMMFRGSHSLSASQFSNITAVTGGRFNANTGNNVTQYFFTMPAQYLDIALNLEASRASDLLNSQALWDEERKAIEQEVTRDNNSDAGYRLYAKMLGQLMAGTPYADTGLGTLHSFGQQINAPQLKDFYESWYYPNNATYVVVGDIDPLDTFDKIKNSFGKISAGKLPTRQAVYLEPLKPAVFKDVSDKGYTTVYLGYRFPGYDSVEYPASRILADVLNSQRGKLYDLVASGQAFSATFEAKPFSQAGIAMATASSGLDAAGRGGRQDQGSNRGLP
ncbi:MAG: M16 family metallopeptidase [Methylobacter sp.]